MSEFRVTQLSPDAGMVDFGIGQPAFELLPVGLLREAAAERLAEGDAEFLNYGYELGDGAFRQLLAQFLSAQMDASVAPEQLMVTSGASQGLDMICTHFAREGDVVFVEEPTYFLALRIFSDRGLRVVPVPAGAQGIELDVLEEMLKIQRPAFLYTIPTFQNPSGATLPAAQRERLVRLAQQHGFLVVADEVYHLLHYDRKPPAPLASYAGSERVLSLGSFSKILAPGLRLGWIQAAPSLLQPMASSGLLDSGGGLNPFTSNIVRPLLESDRLAAHIAGLRAVYGRRVATMDLALHTVLGNSCRYTKPNGGFFFWVAVSNGADTETLLAAARQQGVAFQPGRKFSAAGGCQSYMRLSFAFYDEEQIEAGVQRLARLLS